MTGRYVGVGIVVAGVFLVGCGNGSEKPGACQNLPVKTAQGLIQSGRYGATKAAWVSTGRTSHGEPVSAVAISTVQHQTLLLGHAQAGESFRGGFWVALDPATEQATGFPGRSDGIVGDIAADVHADDLAAVKNCL